MDGISRTPALTDEQMELVKSEWARKREADYWHTMIVKARFDHGDYWQCGGAGRVLWGVVGLVCYCVDRAYRYLSAINRA